MYSASQAARLSGGSPPAAPSTPQPARPVTLGHHDPSGVRGSHIRNRVSDFCSQPTLAPGICLAAQRVPPTPPRRAACGSGHRKLGQQSLQQTLSSRSADNPNPTLPATVARHRMPSPHPGRRPALRRRPRRNHRWPSVPACHAATVAVSPSASISASITLCLMDASSRSHIHTPRPPALRRCPFVASLLGQFPNAAATGFLPTQLAGGSTSLLPIVPTVAT